MQTTENARLQWLPDPDFDPVENAKNARACVEHLSLHPPTPLMAKLSKEKYVKKKRVEKPRKEKVIKPPKEKKAELTLMDKKEAKLFCFTYFIDDEKGRTIARFEEELKQAACYGYQQERCPETEKVHYQGWLYMEKSIQRHRVRNLFADRWFQICDGNVAQQIDYCSKQASKIGEYITNWSADIVSLSFKNGPGMRNDINAMMDYIDAHVHTMEQLHRVGNIPERVALVRYSRQAEARLKYKAKPPFLMSQIPEWGDVLDKYLQGPVHERAIIWMKDSAGCRGKSIMFKHLVCNAKALGLTGLPKAHDVSHTWTGQKIVVLDIPRPCPIGELDFSMLEQLKGGAMFSGKYGSETKIAPEPIHFIVFSNNMPPTKLLTEDKIYVVDMDLDPDLTEGINPPPVTNGPKLRPYVNRWL